MCIKGNIGIELKKPKSLLSEFEYFFSEDQGRYIIEVNKKDLEEVTKILDKKINKTLMIRLKTVTV